MHSCNKDQNGGVCIKTNQVLFINIKLQYKYITNNLGKIHSCNTNNS